MRVAKSRNYLLPVNIDAGGGEFEEARPFHPAWVNVLRNWVKFEGDGETWMLPLVNASIVYEEG